MRLTYARQIKAIVESPEGRYTYQEVPLGENQEIASYNMRTSCSVMPSGLPCDILTVKEAEVRGRGDEGYVL